MEGKIRLSSGQIALAAAQICWAGLLVYLPPNLISIARQDAWISLLAGSLVGGAVLLCLVGLSRRFPRADLYQSAIAIAGPWAGRAAGLLLVLYSLIVAALDLRSVADFFVGIVMPQTPIVVVMAVLMGVAGWAVRHGPEVLCRVNGATFVVCILVLLTLPLALHGRMHGRGLLPLLESGPEPMLRGSYVAAGWLASVVELGVLLPLAADPGRARRGLYYGTALGLLAQLFLLVLILLVFGPEIGGYLYKPADVVVTMMSLGEFAERVDMILIAVWQPTVILRMAISLYAASVGVQRTCGLNDRRPAVFPLAVTVIGFSLWSWPSYPSAYDFIRETFPLISLLAAAGIPAGLWLLAGLRGRRAAAKG